MGFLKKLFNVANQEKKQDTKQPVKLSLDDSFVNEFINKGGKFLYCTSLQEVKVNLKHIFKENNWSNIHILDQSLYALIKDNKHINTENNINDIPILTSCEHLISDSGHILFSSNQLRSVKLHQFSKDFVVFAKASQLVRDTGEALTAIKTNYKDNLPTNISAIKNYNFSLEDSDFMSYGNSNAKNLYLLLFEDF